MFAQVIQSTTSDSDGVRRQLHRWDDDLARDAAGFAGAASGVTSDGIFISMVCFNTAEQAVANSKRSQQTAWWNETEKYFDSNVTFRDAADVEFQMNGPTTNAGFVQIMQGTIHNRVNMDRLNARMSELTVGERPDFIGSITAFHDNSTFSSFSFFTSEDDARANESKPMSDAVMALMEEWQNALTVNAWLDLSDPWIQVG